jgi:serine protease Do
MKKKLLIIIPLIVLIVVIIFNCSISRKFNHNIPSTHPLVKFQERLEEIIDYSKNSVVKISGGESSDIILDFNSLNYRDWIIGSGFVFKKDDKYLYILTNYHVINKIKNIRVSFNNGYEKDARIVGKDKATDIAVIKVKIDEDLENIEPLEFRASDNIKPGDLILVAGIPYNLKLSYTLGIVSALDVNPGISEYEDYIQVNASINPGNSGGPVFDIYGYVVGMCVATVQYGQGIGFVIPASTLQYVSEELLRYKKVRRGWLGLTVDSVYKFPQSKTRHGVLVINVVKNSPAYKSGIKTGDIILEIDNHKILNAEDFRAFEERLKPGKVVNIKILRNDPNTGEYKTIILSVKVGERKENSFDL